jgi:hypothetical protein
LIGVLLKGTLNVNLHVFADHREASAMTLSVVRRARRAFFLTAIGFIASFNSAPRSYGFPGDYNNDGGVDEADYVPWQNNEGTNNVLPNDPVGGTIGQPQYDNWTANFGQGAGSNVAHEGGPTLLVTNVGLNAAGNWVWRVQIVPGDSITSGSSMAATIGFRESAPSTELLGATNLSTGPGDDFDTATPGLPIFGWEAFTDVDPGAGVNFVPIGVQVNLATDEVFTALGSQVYSTTGPKDYIEIEASRPRCATRNCLSPAETANRTTTLQILGPYGGKGRIAVLSPEGVAVNYDHYSGTFSRTVTPGDTDLVNGVTLTDFNNTLAGLGTGTTWQQGNFDNIGTTGLTDFGVPLVHFGEPSGGAGAWSYSRVSSAIPEPASLFLVAVCVLLRAGMRHTRGLTTACNQARHVP